MTLRLQHQPEELRKSALSCIRLTSAVTLPAMAVIASVSRPLMAAIGPQWIPASPVLKLLCVLGVAIVFAYFTGPLMQALGRTREVAILEWARMAIGTVVLLGAGFAVRNGSIQLQISGIAMARLFTGALIVAPFFVYILMRLSRISLREFALSVGPSAISAGSIVASILLFGSAGYLRTGRPMFLLLVEIALGGVVGVVVLLGLETQLRRSALSLVRRSVSRLMLAKQAA